MICTASILPVAKPRFTIARTRKGDDPNPDTAGKSGECRLKCNQGINNGYCGKTRERSADISLGWNEMLECSPKYAPRDTTLGTQRHAHAGDRMRRVHRRICRERGIPYDC